MHRVIATDLVVSDALILTLVAVCVELTLRQLLSQGFRLLCLIIRLLLLRCSLRSLSLARLLGFHSLVLVLLSLLALLLFLIHSCRLLILRIWLLFALVLETSKLVLFICLSCRVKSSLSRSGLLSSDLALFAIFSGALILILLLRSLCRGETHRSGRRCHSLRIIVVVDTLSDFACGKKG